MDREELEQEREWRRCSENSFEGYQYFVENYWHIKVPGGSPLLILREPQVVAARVWFEERHSISLKARQIGWSTLCSSFAFWETFFFPDRDEIFLSRNEREAKKLKKKVDYGYTRLPEYMIERGPRVLSTNLLAVEFDNGSSMEAMPSRENAARGSTGYRIWVDEWAFLQDPEEAWASIKPAADIGGRITGISTANGFGNWFHLFYLDAKNGVNDFKALFFPWNSVPGRDAAWFERESRGMTPAMRAQEYPVNDEECFVQSGNPAFNTDMLKDVCDIKDPIAIGQMALHEGRHVFIKDSGGDLSIWSMPTPGQKYAIGGDVALGVEGGDNSTAHVIEARTGRVVARYKGKCHPEDFADILDSLGRFYNNAYLGVERNTHGESTVKRLLHELNYPNLYFHTRENARRTKTRNVGWLTTQRSKTLMIDTLTSSLRSRRITVFCMETLSELIAFSRIAKRDGTDKYEGKPHDDLVISLGIANMMLEDIPEASLPNQEAVLVNGASYAMFESLLNSAGIDTAHDGDRNVGFFVA